MQIAVFGGSFDPVHRGHIAVADAAMETLYPDELLWVPARHAPHKEGEPSASGTERADLLEVAIADRPRERVCRIELDREGPSYTVDTLIALEREYPDAEFVLVIGADSLEHLASWRDLPGLFHRARFALVPRRGWNDEALEKFAASLPIKVLHDFRASFLPMEPVDVSSTELREKLARGESCEDSLPPGVEEEIRRRCLYLTR